MKLQTKNLKALIAPLFFIVLFGCDNETEYEKQVKEDDRKIQEYLSTISLEFERRPSGVYYRALETNAGGEEVETGDVVSFYYKIATLDNAYEEIIADSLKPVYAEQGYDRMVPSGLFSALALMKNGEKYRFIIPSYLAYNYYGKTDFFSPYSIFIVDVEIVDIMTKDEVNALELDSINSYIENNNIEDIEFYSSGLFYKSIEEGTGAQPSTNGIVKFNYLRKYLDGSGVVKSETNKPVEIRLNENNMTKGLVEGISKMKKGGKAMFIVPSKIGYGSSFVVLPMEIRSDLIEDKIINPSPLPFSPLVYEIELLDIN